MKLAMRLSSEAMKNTFFTVESISEAERSTEIGIVEALISKSVATGTQNVGKNVTTSRVAPRDGDLPCAVYGRTFVDGDKRKLLDFLSTFLPLPEYDEAGYNLSGAMDIDSSYPLGNGNNKQVTYTCAYLIPGKNRGKNIKLPRTSGYIQTKSKSSAQAIFKSYMQPIKTEYSPEETVESLQIFSYDKRVQASAYGTASATFDLPRAEYKTGVNERCIVFSNMIIQNVRGVGTSTMRPSKSNLVGTTEFSPNHGASLDSLVFAYILLYDSKRQTRKLVEFEGALDFLSPASIDPGLPVQVLFVAPDKTIEV